MTLRIQPEQQEQKQSCPAAFNVYANEGNTSHNLSHDTPRFDIPRRGHVLTSVAETYGSPIREAVAILSGSLARNLSCANYFTTLFGSSFRQPQPETSRGSAEMASWAVVSMWLSAVASGALSGKTTLKEAEAWFFGPEQSVRLTSLPSNQAIRKAERKLRIHQDPTAYLQLFPYILDPHGPGSRLSVMRNPETRETQIRKREKGVFYTPADVAEYMVTSCVESIDIKEFSSPPTVFDPACGTGVFLRATLKELRRCYPERSAMQIASKCLFGVDIDPWPLNATAFLLLTDIWNDEKEKGKTPSALWRKLHRNFVCFDALCIDPAVADTNSHVIPQLDFKFEAGGRTTRHKDRVKISQLFPALNEGPDVIIGNPPYADLGNRDDYPALVSTFKTLSVKSHQNAEIYLAFLEQMVRLTRNDNCVGAMVLPLSLASNVGPQFTEARKLIEESPGRWRFAFFDRQPHALFGEDVKTRNTIVVWSRSKSDNNATVATGPLQKWRGESRAEMFKALQFTEIKCGIQSGIPKINGDHQAKALSVLGNRLSYLEQAVLKIGRTKLIDASKADDNTIFVGPTAYNFLNVFLKPPSSLLSSSQMLSEHSLFSISCASKDDALAVFSILSSNLAYWWWRSYDDGFHVSRRFIATLPFGPEALQGDVFKKLSSSGFELWSKIRNAPVLSNNRGRISLAYKPDNPCGIRRNADQALVILAGLDRVFIDELQHFSTHTAKATFRYQAAEQSKKREVA